MVILKCHILLLLDIASFCLCKILPVVIGHVLVTGALAFVMAVLVHLFFFFYTSQAVLVSYIRS